MRDTEERINAVKQEMDRLEADRRRRDKRIAYALAAACLMLVIGVAAAMPGWIGQVPDISQGGNGVSASVFAGSPVLDYLVVGIFAFFLGATATIFCFRLAKRSEDEDRVL